MLDKIKSELKGENMRRVVAVTAALAVSCSLLAACGGGSDDDTIRLGFAVEKDAANLPYVLGKEKGIFEECGLDVDLVYFEGGGAMVPPLAVGEIDYGWTGTQTVLTAAEAGAEIRSVAEVNKTSAGWGLMVAPDSPIKSLSDLSAGMAISFTSQGTSSHWWALWSAQQAGVGEADVSGVPLGGSLPAIRTALETGDIDAAVVLLPWGDVLEKAGFRWVSKFDEELPDLNFSTLNASKESLENPEVTAQLLGGYVKTVQWMKDNREETEEFLADNYDLDDDIAEKVYDQVVPDLNETGIMPQEKMDYLINTVQEVPGFLEGNITGQEMLQQVEPAECS